MGRPREDGGAIDAGLPVLRMPAVVGSRHNMREQEGQGHQHAGNQKRSTASQTELPHNPILSSQTQTSPPEQLALDGVDAPQRIYPSNFAHGRDGGLKHAWLPTEHSTGPPHNPVCSSQTQTDASPEDLARDNSPHGVNPFTYVYHQDREVKHAWLPAEIDSSLTIPAAIPFPLLRLPSEPPADRSAPNAGSTPKSNKNPIAPPPHTSPRLLNVDGQRGADTRHVTKLNFLEVPVKRSGLPLLRMPQSVPPSPPRPGLDLSKLRLLEMPTKPPTWKPLHVPEKPNETTGSDKVKLLGMQNRDRPPGWPLLRMPEKQSRMPDLGKMNLLQNPPSSGSLPQWPLLQLHRKSDPPTLVPLATLLAFERERMGTEKCRDNIIMSEKENLRPPLKGPVVPRPSGKPAAQERLNETKSAPQLLHFEGPRWKERNADERNTASR